MDEAQLGDEQKTIVKGAFWGIAGNIAVKFVSFVYLVIIARLASQDDVGTFYLALSIIGALSIFSDLGISSAFARYIPYYCGKEQKEKAYLLLQASYLFSGILAIALAGVLFFSASGLADAFRNADLARPIQFASLYLILITFFGLNFAFLQGRKRIKEANILNTSQNLLKLGLTMLFFWIIGTTINSIMLGFVLSFLFVTVASFLYAKKETALFGIKNAAYSLRDHISMLKEIVPFGFTLSLVGMLWSLVGYSDKIMLGYMLPQESATISIAVYTVATSLATLLVMFPSAVGAIFLPLLSELYGKGKMDEMRKISVTAVRWILLLITPLMLLLIVFPDDLLSLFYGASYASGGLVLMLFTIGMFIRLFSSVHGWILAAFRFVRLEFYAALVATVANIALNAILIPFYGIEGAAIASLVSFIIVTVILVYYSQKVFSFGIPTGLHKPLVSAVISLVVLVVIKDFVVGLIDAVPAYSLFNVDMLDLIAQKIVKLAIFGILFLFSCGIYFLALLGMKAFEKEDVSLVGTGLRKAGISDRFVIMAQRMLG